MDVREAADATEEADGDLILVNFDLQILCRAQLIEHRGFLPLDAARLTAKFFSLLSRDEYLSTWGMLLCYALRTTAAQVDGNLATNNPPLPWRQLGK